MNNPWLEIPLADYEGHMALPGIEQAQLLADIFSGAIQQYSPRSIAVLGCAGGNGFDRIPSGIARVVGVDLNPRFVAEARARFGLRFANLELLVGDIQRDDIAFAPVDLLFAGLVLEYVDVEAVIAKLPALLTANGRLVTVLQLPSASQREISPSPFTSIQAIREIIRLVPPPRLLQAAVAQGFVQLASQTVASVSGKEFQVQVFAKTP